MRRMRHFRGETGDVLKTRAAWHSVSKTLVKQGNCLLLTFLEDGGAVDLDDAGVVLVLLVEAHGGGGGAAIGAACEGELVAEQ